MNSIMIRPLNSAGRNSTCTEPSRLSCSFQKMNNFSLFKRISSCKQRISKQILKTRPNTTCIKPTTINSKVTRVPSYFSEINTNTNFTRKQNHLNTCYNIRKTKLKKMTKQNIELYQRITAQKSIYSNAQFNKSYRSTCQIKKMLSQSKLSHRSHSQGSARKTLYKNADKQLEQKPKLQIKPVSIQNIHAKDLNDIRSLFKKVQLNQSKNKETEGQMKGMCKFNYHKRHNSYLVTRVAAKKQLDFSLGQTIQGGLLHRIAEDLIENKQNYPMKQSGNIFQRKKIGNH